MMNSNHTYIQAPAQGQVEQHDLWSTPIIMARPFSPEFVEQLSRDTDQYLTPGAVGTFNHTDIWSLPDLPDTMCQVRDRMVELAEQAFRPGSEVPLPPLRIAKGYFRDTEPTSPYGIMPHRHGNSLGVGICYVHTDDTNPGNLVFIDPRGGVNWTNQFTAYKKIRVEPGLIIVHPGYLIHFVEPTDPARGLFYGRRRAIVSNIHRTHEEWLDQLKKNEDMIRDMGGNKL